ncbi:hypothetical protein CLF_106128 [Clonorchis sinensis]|uniref:Uncharacterized protein n=1 Tax=Clonorchis sinensis TaxID=79923 RepID=G7YPN9_CLOSI|nr:hypothetical protein CLF_106128 [Clonorchis sinensis]
MVSLLLATVPLFLWLTAMCPVEWKYNMMRLVLLEVIKPGTKDLGNKVKQLKYATCSTKDAYTTTVNGCVTNLKAVYVNLLKNKAEYTKYNTNLTDYVSQKIGQVLAVTELIKDNKCIQADVPVVPKKNEDLLTSFGLLEEALKIYVKIASTLAEVKDYREAVAELLKTLLTDLTGKIKAVVDEGVQCSDSIPTLIHHAHVGHSHRVFTETMSSVMTVFTFLSDDLKFTRGCTVTIRNVVLDGCELCGIRIHVTLVWAVPLVPELLGRLLAKHENWFLVKKRFSSDPNFIKSRTYSGPDATDAFGASLTNIKSTQNTIVGQFDKLDELCINCLNCKTSKEFSIEQLITTDHLGIDRVFVTSSGLLSCYLWLTRGIHIKPTENVTGGTPTSVWPVLEFGKLQAYKLAADVFQMKQPTGCSLTDDGKEADAIINKLKDLVNNMNKFNMELPSTRYSMKKTSSSGKMKIALFTHSFLAKYMEAVWRLAEEHQCRQGLQHLNQASKHFNRHEIHEILVALRFCFTFYKVGALDTD